jgi:hypothetical protein
MEVAHWIASEVLDTWVDVLGECSEIEPLSSDAKRLVGNTLARWRDRHMDKANPSIREET